MKVTVESLLRATGGQLVQGDRSTIIESFCNDSRLLRPDSCFVAIRAERDGHDFIGDASAHGASVALTDRSIDSTVGRDIAIVRVGSTLEALADIARQVRHEVLASANVVGITGSTGKTSTKDLCAGALRSVRVHTTSQSFNNEIGLPLTILDAPENTEVLVLEMGARFRGNIQELCDIAAPSIGIITNIGLAHAEHLGGIAGVLATKGELFASLPENGLAILPAGEFADALSERTSAETMRVGLKADASARPDVTVHVVDLDEELRPTVRIESPWGAAEMRVGLRGAHQGVNAAMAFVAALRCGVEVEAAADGISRATGSDWRMEVVTVANDVTLINDSYNANPTSMRAAIDALTQAPCRGHRIAVVGSMRELGLHSEEEHLKLGARCAEAPIDILICVGEEGAWIARGAELRIDSMTGRRFATVDTVKDAEAASAVLEKVVGPGDTILVKASRALGLEAVAKSVQGYPTRGGAS